MSPLECRTRRGRQPTLCGTVWHSGSTHGDSERLVQLGLIGLGRMGGNMALRWVEAGHECVVYAREPKAIAAVASEGAVPASSLADLTAKLRAPRVIWIMIPAAAVDGVIDELAPALAVGDTLIDGGNSHYVDDVRRATALAQRGLHYVDVGVSGGVYGRELGYCQMIGGEPAVVARLDALFAALAPGAHEPASADTARRGYLYCGPSGAGHFVKMVHNGIEYGLMAAYAEGFNLLRQAGVGRQPVHVDAETAPRTLRGAHLTYDFNVRAI